MTFPFARTQRRLGGLDNSVAALLTFNNTDQDASPNNNDATLSTGTYYSTTNFFGNSEYNLAHDADDNHYATIPAAGFKPNPSGDFTIDFWLYSNVLGAAKFICYGNAGGYAGIVMNLTAADKFQVLASVDNTSWGVGMASTTAILAGTWYHFALERYGNLWTIFVDGVAENSATLSGTINDGGSTNWLWGRHAAAGYAINGGTMDLRVSAKAQYQGNNFIRPNTRAA